MTTPIKQTVVVLTEEQLLQMINPQEPHRPLVRGRRILCPHCETEFDILEYQALHFVEKYADDLVPVMKCKGCRHVFSIRPDGGY